MKDFKKFELSKMKKTNLSKLSGGNTGVETNTCEGTSIGDGWSFSFADSSRDGDWISTCISAPVGQTSA